MKNDPKHLAKFNVIEGGGLRSPSWLALPSTVIGRSIRDRNLSEVYRIAQGDARKALEHNRRQPRLDLWSAVLGEIPPVPNAATKWERTKTGGGLTSLLDARACFRGIKRPMGDDDRGYDVCAFITKPRFYFTYESSLTCVIKAMDVPTDLVHVTYVRLDYPERWTNTSQSRQNERVIGVVTHWEFVESDPADLDLPMDFADRYRQRLW